MKITPEMMGKFANCKSAEEVLDLAKQEKFSMTTDESQKLFDLLQSEDISDEMMEKIAAGIVGYAYSIDKWDKMVFRSEVIL